MRVEQVAILALGRRLQKCDYRFISPTPETIRRVNQRPQNLVAQSLQDVFGWSRRFRVDLLPDDMLHWLRSAGALEQEGGFYRSRIRFSTLEGGLYAHSAYPTTAQDAVFFGPDSYRFCRLIGETLRRYQIRRKPRMIDVGCGSGVGAIASLRHLTLSPTLMLMADINPHCLAFARINAALNGIQAESVASDGFAAVGGEFDLVLSNPPYLADPAHRLYRDGGGTHGGALSLRLLGESLARLAPGGLLVLYTGAAIIAGQDRFLAAARSVLDDERPSSWDYNEIDPDVFGEELETPAYRDTDRIAAVGLIVQR